ncbi:hypothetical protein BGW38_007517 [Lunasporangiospora selenospora]|uniref:Uncharacterized protein n=1 Tax=Lunasporangiospora selenospora TaxID=979761 RepID=A0A9P6KA15_9FUNG|nr:hypothetical protein BGW38_007517 [Lunasporangiospora selenospora]
MLQSLKGKLTRSGRDLATDTLAPGQEPIHDAAATDIVGSLSLLTVNETVHERITEQTISELEVKEPMANTDGQEPSTSPVHSPRLRFKEILKTFTRKDTVVTATATAGPAQDHSSITAAVTQGSVVHRDNNDHDSDSDSFGKDFDDIEYDENDEDLSDDEILTTPCCDEVDVVTVAFNVPSGPSGSKSKTPYPATINAKFVKLQSLHQNVDGLRHALYAAIQKSSAIKEVGRLCKSSSP